MKYERKGFLIRLWNDEVTLFKKRVVEDKMNMQKVCEVLIKMYLEGNPEIANRISKYKSLKYSRKRRYNQFDRYESEILQRKIDEISPITEMDRLIESATEEIDKKNDNKKV